MMNTRLIRDDNEDFSPMPISLLSMPVGQRSRLLCDVIVMGLGFSCLIIVALVFVWEAMHSYGISAYDDVYDKLRLYRTAGTPTASLRQIFALHNEHRITTTRLIMVADEWFDGGREWFQIIASNIIQCLSAALCATTMLRPIATRQPSLAEVVGVCGLVLLMFVNPNLLETLDLPFQVQHAIMGLLAVLAAWLVSRSADGSPDAGAARALLLQLLGLAVVASLTLGNAPVLLIAAFVAAVIFRWGWRMSVTLGLFALVHLILTVTTTPGVGSTARSLWAILDFTIVYLGSPFVRVMAWPAGLITWATPMTFIRLIGVASIAIPVGFAVQQLLAPRRGRGLEAFGLCLCVVVIVTALAAGYARSQFGIEAATDKKYASFAALNWVGCFALGLAGARRLAWPSGMAVILVATILVLPASVVALDREERIWGDFMNRNWLAAMAVYTGVADRNSMQAIYPEPKQLQEFANDLEIRNRGVFSRYPFRVGTPLSVVVAHAVETPCRSEVERVDPVAESDLAYPLRVSGKPFKSSGWTWMTSRREPADVVVAIGPDDRVVGLAHAVSVSPRAALWLSQSFTEQLGWAGYAIADTAADLRFIALTRDGRAYCTLGRLGEAR